ncbi:SIS domain-containing protein [Pseudarthrobacter sp. NIBRBAC000502770]|uniref:D-sedoheptulose-7-phosphate isomerase n=1 Tax=Pseudarthrobacter sp. NIBRBAC000502770 TaxID=2590785 RepID=UPI00114061EC|nr:SIS domain-containing protein [Pseudarthrobacter sp. NIBRBAC000502770]QDG90577.1 SIS domain-containing protein [Pseudarthrobacter sp. NIBRBAC000502770]
MTAESSLREADLRTLTGAPPLPAVLPGATFVDPASAEAVRTHLDNVIPALDSLRSQSGRLAAWGVELAQRLLRGQRILAAGNGGSAAEAQHLTAELVGRFDSERVPFSAISLHAESSAVTAIANDYGYDEVFSRQVRAHGRSGDVLMLLSTSGKSPNLLRAAEAAARLNVTTWALTGSGPNPLADVCDQAVMIDALNANAQEGHLIALHAICRAFDLEVARHTPSVVAGFPRGGRA